MNNHSSKQKGFSLLEVVVSVFIISVGVIGIAGLQLTTSVYAESSLHRSQAASLAREIVERMRQNLDEAKAGGYDFSTLPSKTRSCKGNSKNCSAAQLRDYDEKVWAARVTSLLPGGDAAISTGADNSTDPVQIVVTLQWDENRGQQNLVSQAFTFELYGLAIGAETGASE